MSLDLDVDAASLTPEIFCQKMSEYGCILIKNLFPSSEIDPIKMDTLDLFQLIKNLIHNNLISEQSQKYLAGGHPADILPSLKSLEHVLNKGNFISCLKAYFKKEEFVVNVESTGIRRCDPAIWKNYLPWHQDIFARDDRFLTCWMPLRMIDSDTPGLDLVPCKVTKKLAEQDGLDVSYNNIGLTEDFINKEVGKIRWTPRMNVGDILIFDPYCPHRTSYSDDFKNERFSIDIRIHPSDLMPEETWKTNVITLPSKSTDPLIEAKRNLFNIKHLVNVETIKFEQEISDRGKADVVNFAKRVARRCKNILRKLAS